MARPRVVGPTIISFFRAQLRSLQLSVAVGECVAETARLLAPNLLACTIPEAAPTGVAPLRLLLEPPHSQRSRAAPPAAHETATEVDERWHFEVLPMTLP